MPLVRRFGGLVAGDEQDEGHAPQFLRREPVAVLGGGADQIAEQVVGGARAALVLDQVAEVFGEPHERVVLRARAGGRHRLRGQLAELRAVQLGHAQELTDHGDRQRIGERLDEVGAAGGQHGVEEFVGDLLDARAEFLDAAHRERAGDQPAQAGVVGRIGDQQVSADQLLVEERHPDLAAVLGESRVGQRGARLVVPHDQPGHVVRVRHRQAYAVDRARLPQHRVHPVRVPSELLAEFPRSITSVTPVPSRTTPRGLPVQWERTAAATSARSPRPLRAGPRRRPTGRSAPGC